MLFCVNQVSNGAECVLISKQFLKAQLNSSIAHSLRSKVSDGHYFISLT